MNALALFAAAIAVPLVLSACGGSSSDNGSSGDTHIVAVTITDAGCEPATIETVAGSTEFEVKNDGAESVTEFEVLDGDKVLGEAENVASGLTSDFTLDLEAGTYTTYCPGGTTSERGTLSVTAAR